MLGSTGRKGDFSRIRHETWHVHACRRCRRVCEGLAVSSITGTLERGVPFDDIQEHNMDDLFPTPHHSPVFDYSAYSSRAHWTTKLVRPSQVLL